MSLQIPTLSKIFTLFILKSKKDIINKHILEQIVTLETKNTFLKVEMQKKTYPFA